MKVKCIRCGKEFNDGYILVNNTNRRVYCNECIRKMWIKKDNRYL